MSITAILQANRFVAHSASGCVSFITCAKICSFLVMTCLVVSVGFSGRAQAQVVPKPESRFLGVGITPKPDVQVPGDIMLWNEDGQEVQLQDYFGDKPIILNLVYFQCPKLCGLSLRSMLEASQAIPQQLQRDYVILTVSIDPREKPELAKQKKAAYISKYARPGGEEGWHFLTGPEENSKHLADTVGFSYEFDSQNNQYAHDSALIFLTPEGRVSRYLFGLNYSPRDVRLALMESGQGKIDTRTMVDRAFALCYEYDPLNGKYGLAISFLLKTSAALTVLVLGTFVYRSMRHDYTKSQTPSVNVASGDSSADESKSL